MTKIITSIILSAVVTIPVYAQEQADTLKTQELNEVVVQAQMQRTSSAHIHSATARKFNKVTKSANN